MKKEAYKNDITTNKTKQKQMTFVEAIKLGLADYKDIHQYLHKWHVSNSNLEAYEFLGMTKEQYFEFAVGHEKSLRRMFPRKK